MALNRRPYGEGKYALAQFLLDHGAFRLEVVLVDREVDHALGLGPEQALQMIRRHRFEVVGEIVVGRRVVVSADVLGQAIELLGLQMLRALEHQVLEQVRKAAAPGRIILRADVIPDLHGNGRARVVLDTDDLQAVGERALLERDRRDRQRVRRARRRAGDQAKAQAGKDASQHDVLQPGRLGRIANAA